MNILDKHNVKRMLVILVSFAFSACSSRMGKRDPLISSKVEAIVIENHVKLLRGKNGREPSPSELHAYIVHTKSGSRWLELWTFNPNDSQVIASKRDVIKMNGKRVDVNLMRSGEIIETINP